MTQKNTALLLILTLAMAGLVVAADEENPAPPVGAVIHTTVDRVDATPRDPELLGQATSEGEMRVAELQARLMEGRQHPKPGAPMEIIDLDPSILVPLNPPVNLASPDGPGLSPELFVNTNPSNAASVNSRSEVHEPAVAASGDRVFYTANWYTAASSDGSVM